MNYVSLAFEKTGDMICEYGSFGQTLSMAHKTSLLMGIVLFAISIVYKDITLWIVTKGLLVFEFIIWCVQVIVDDIREDPWCHGQRYYAVPNMEIFYVWCLGWILVCFYFIWKWKFGWVNWVLLIIWFILPPAILIWTDNLAFWEVLISIGSAILAGSLFVFGFKNRICPMLPNIITTWPATMFGLKDISGCMSKREQIKYAKLVKIKSYLRGIEKEKKRKEKKRRNKSKVFGEWGY